MQQIPLAAEKRTILGRKVKTLRRGGLIPAHVFGHKVPTIHVQVKKSDFTKVFEEAGETGIVDLAVDGQKHPTLIRSIQVHPVTDEPLHIDFYQVNLQEKVKVNVPIEIVGKPSAVEKKIGLLLTPLNEIEIEALPTDIPESIQVDVSKLENVGDEIKVKDLNIDRTKIEVQADQELVVAQIGELVTKEMEAVEAEIEAEQAEAAAAEAPAEGEAPAEAPAEGAGAEGAEVAPAEGEEAKAESAAKTEPRSEGRKEKKEEPAKREEKPQEQPKKEK
ncbi:MAG: 50S ribosomal protein L25 [Patescibacteria group bacterium]